ncbi:MAG TPA: ADOP family duplicated permease [Terracidiphilus sp.]|jgi:predicted permease|nr:ADOP family duplicated permease [Terracidiphilus sp.]
MEWLRIAWSRGAALFGAGRLDADLDEELRSHLELATEENRRRGMAAEEARTAALRAFGGVAQTREAYRTQRGMPWLETLAGDARYGLRQLKRDRGFTLTVLLTLALAIGANTAIFSVVNALLLESLPYAHPERMGTIFLRVQGAQPFDGMHRIDGAQWETLRDNVPALIAAISGSTSGVNLQAGAQAQYVHDGRVSAHYFEVLAIRPLLGRGFTENEDRPNGPKAAILSYGLWRSVLGGDGSIVGQAIRLKGESYTVIGVLPEGTQTPLDADVYTALQPSRTGEGGGSNFEVITRLRDGATWQQADAQINRAWAFRAAQYRSEYPGSGRLDFHSVPLQEGETAELGPQALSLMLAAGLILLIACANLAGLTLVRMARRASEVATRMALGASRWRIQRQLWIENLMLACAGGAVGVGVGLAALRGLLALLPEHFLPVAGVHLDGRALAFTLALTLLTSVLFGMLPALTARRVNLRAAMTSQAVAGTEKLRLRQCLIAGEVALCMVLLSGAGLLIRTLIHLETLPQGFNPEGIMTAKASLDDRRFQDPAAFAKLLDESTAAMLRIPGVTSAAVGLSLPYERAMNDMVNFSDGKQTGQRAVSGEVYVTPGYFETLEMPLVGGRYFTASDGPNAQAVAIVNRTFARKFYGETNPVGRVLNKGRVIVGVVTDVPIAPGIDPTAPLASEETVYIPAAQFSSKILALVHMWFQPSWIVRTAGPVTGLTEQMQHALADADPGLPFSGFYSMKDLLVRRLATQRIEVALLGTLAGLALLLSAVGIFALVANIVAQRTREIGIRMALGANLRQAMAHVSATGVRAAGAGLLLGLALCAVALPAMRSVLYGVAVYDAATGIAVALTLAAVSLLASLAPALRIARIDPARTLREQ